MPSDQDATFVPDWAKRVVWYQIFPERFWNGDPGNDPDAASLAGAHPFSHSDQWEVHPWTAEWYKLQPYEQVNGRDIWHNILRRRYGGDVQGILDRLRYLQDLGIGALYLNPVFEAPSHHKYDGATYHHIDPFFGPDPEGDKRLMAAETPDDPENWVWTAADKLMLQLIKEVHRRGMRIIFDGVWNHMGLNSWAFRDVVNRQQESRFKEWFKIKAWDNAAVGSRFDYTGWAGVATLPEMQQDENGIVDGPRGYIYAATRRWMDPDGDGDPGDGIDGWRLDVAYCVRHPFWKAWREYVRDVNPRAYLVGEVIDTPVGTEPYLRGDEFDAVMNYNFAYPSMEYFLGVGEAISTTEFDRRLRDLREAYPTEVAYVMQNLYGSHDTNRLASHVVNRGLSTHRTWDEYHALSKVVNNPDYQTRKPTTEEIALQKLMVIFQMTYVGAPMVYYGDEAGMWGANDPCCRKPMVWPELSYEAEATLPDGTQKVRPDVVAFDHDLFAHYQKLIHIRNLTPALQVGDFQTLSTDDAGRLYAFRRHHQGEEVLVVLNASGQVRRAEIQMDGAGTLVDLLNGGVTYEIRDGRLIVEVAGRWGAVLRRQ